MKYVVIGTGKTGGVILNSLPKGDVVAACDENNPATKEIIQKADVGIVFVPGKVMGAVLPVLLDSRVPMVVGTTGFDWPADLDQKLKTLKTPWVIGQNYSIALNVMRYFSVQIKNALNTLRPGQLNLGLTETHHIHKLDAPSGTAIYIANALGFPLKDIKAIREGEVKGIHTVTYDWPNDRIALTHESLDRATFAEGVKLACDNIAKLAPGLHRFEKLADDLIEGKK